MKPGRPLRSSRKLWLAISIPLFIACWFIRGGKGGDEPYGALWWVFINNDYICPVSEMLGMLAFISFIFAAFAGVAGWILQFFVRMVLDRFRPIETTNERPENP